MMNRMELLVVPVVEMLSEAEVFNSEFGPSAEDVYNTSFFVAIALTGTPPSTVTSQDYDRLSNLEAGSMPSGTSDAGGGPAYYNGTTDAIQFAGGINRAVIGSPSGVNACTLGTPVPSTDDNTVLEIYCSSAQAHTVTTAANKIVQGGAAAYHVITSNGHVGSAIRLLALNGLWYVLGGNGNFVVS